MNGVDVREFSDELLPAHNELRARLDEILAHVEVALLLLVQPTLVLPQRVELVPQLNIW